MPPRLFRLVRRFALAGVFLFSIFAQAADSIDAVQAAATEWAKVRAETVRLDTEWTWQRETLAATVGALAERVRVLEEQRDLLKARTASDDKATTDVVARRESAGQALDLADQRLAAIQESLDQLRPYLPPRLSQSVDLLYKSIADATLGPGELMQHTITLLSRCAQFNRAITFAEEVLTVDGAAAPKLFEVIYWGLSHGYALDRVGHAAYLGFPGSSGWKWQAEPDLFRPVSELVAIHQETADPRFVAVPLQIADPFAAARP